jgi:hypothetical protein
LSQRVPPLKCLIGGEQTLATECSECGSAAGRQCIKVREELIRLHHHSFEVPDRILRNGLTGCAPDSAIRSAVHSFLLEQSRLSNDVARKDQEDDGAYQRVASAD